jgi:ParB/RepB/Spo0J family partition protein
MSEFAILKRINVVRSLTNPRTVFDEKYLAELAASIKSHGVVQPLLVRPLPGHRLADTPRNVTHEIVCGECRDRGCEIAGLDEMPVMIRDLSDGEVLRIQLVENLKRKDLSELEEAVGYQTLMDKAGITADAVAVEIGRSRAYVYGRIKLLDLCPEGRTALRAGTIDASRAQLLARIPDHKLQIKALDEITRKDYNGDLSWGYREAAAHVQRTYMLRLDAARFKITDVTLVPDAGSCKTCPKRTGANPDIFADVDSADVCTDPPCFHAKEDAFNTQQLAAAHERGQEVITGREAKALIPNHYGGVDGYLRLDDARDSPTSKPLRKLIGKQMEQDGVQATLIANPHKDGDLIAVLPAEKVAELLKAKGHQEAAERVTKDLTRESERDAEAAEAKAKNDFEQLWRDIMLQRASDAIAKEGGTMWLELTRFIALRYAKACNTERAKIACKHMNLGKVAPVAGLLQHVEETDDPQGVLLYLIMLSEVEYRHWLPADESNQGLFLIADEYGVTEDDVKKEAKKVTKDKISPPKKGDLPQPPLAQPVVGLGDAKAGAKPASARKPKLSAKDAISGIAAAMQGQEQEPSAPEGAVAAPVESAVKESSLLGAFKVGQLVRVTTSDEKLRFKHAKFAGKTGHITGLDIGGKELDVKLGRVTRCFEPGELEAAQ